MSNFIEQELYLYPDGPDFRFGVIEYSEIEDTIEIVYQDYDKKTKSYKTNGTVCCITTDQARLLAEMLISTARHIEERV